MAINLTLNYIAMYLKDLIYLTHDIGRTFSQFKIDAISAGKKLSVPNIYIHINVKFLILLYYKYIREMCREIICN